MAPHGALHIKQKKSAKKRRFRQISAAGATASSGEMMAPDWSDVDAHGRT